VVQKTLEELQDGNVPDTMVKSTVNHIIFHRISFKMQILKRTHLQPTNIQQRSPKHMMEKRQPLQQMLLGKLDIHM
jgi:hypothetical protein